MVAIYTVVSGEYQWYVPLFEWCIKKEYPEYAIIVAVHGPCDLPDKYCEHVVRDKDLDKYDATPFTTAALRFLNGEDTLSAYENVLITDADILMYRQDPPMHEIRKGLMVKKGLRCYDNNVNGDQMLGVHFIDNTWWETTRKARYEESVALRNSTAVKDYDEKMLKRICEKSNLCVPELSIFEDTHGVHLAKFRSGRKTLEPHLWAEEQHFLTRICKDHNFVELAEDCASHSDLVKRVVGNIFHFYRR